MERSGDTASRGEESRRIIQARIRSLPDKQREAVQAYLGQPGDEPKTMPQIARENGVSPQAVQYVIRRAIGNIGAGEIGEHAMGVAQACDQAGIKLTRRSEAEARKKTENMIVNCGAVDEDSRDILRTLTTIALQQRGQDCLPALDGTESHIRKAMAYAAYPRSAEEILEALPIEWRQRVRSWPLLVPAMFVKARWPHARIDADTGKYAPGTEWAEEPRDTRGTIRLLAHEILRDTGAVMHCWEISAEIRRRVAAAGDPNPPVIDERNVLAALHRTNAFRWAGPGRYGLEEWEGFGVTGDARPTRRTGVVSEIHNMLSVRPEGATKDEIVRHVLNRLTVRKSTVLDALRRRKDPELQYDRATRRYHIRSASTKAPAA